MTPKEYVIMQDSLCVPFNKSKIDELVFKAALATRGCDLIMATILADEVAEAVAVFLEENYDHRSLLIEDIQDTVEQVLIGTGHARIARFVHMNDL